MDEDLRRFLRGHGTGGRAVGFHELLPEAPRPDLDSITGRRKRMAALGLARVRLHRHLAANGCDFIHSAADAFWLRDPRPWLMGHPGCDLLFSQGTTHPSEHYRRHRFVLCAGFFLCRANGRTQAYFEQVSRFSESHVDDQFCMNMVLLRAPEARWELGRPAPAVRYGAAWVAPPQKMSRLGYAWTLLLRGVLRALPDRALQRASLTWILTSPEIIRGRFTGDLTVGVVPMHIVARLRFEGWDEPLVSHELRMRTATSPASSCT